MLLIQTANENPKSSLHLPLLTLDEGKGYKAKLFLTSNVLHTFNSTIFLNGHLVFAPYISAKYLQILLKDCNSELKHYFEYRTQEVSDRSQEEEDSRESGSRHPMGILRYRTPASKYFTCLYCSSPWQLQCDYAAPSGPRESNCIAKSH